MSFEKLELFALRTENNKLKAALRAIRASDPNEVGAYWAINKAVEVLREVEK